MAGMAPNTAINWVQRLLAVALLGLIVFWIVRACMVLFTPQSAWTPVVATPSQTNSPTYSGLSSGDFSFDPFNRKSAAPEVEVPEIGEDAPETTLNLTLSGLRAGEDGSAILKTPDGKEDVFEIGDEIVPGVTLKAVNKGFIVLSVDGQIQRLTFTQKSGQAIKQRTDTGNGEPMNANRSLNSTKLATAALSQINVPGSAEIDPSDIFNKISLKRVLEDGRLKGYSVKPTRAGMDLSGFGLKSGDIITEIAGKSLTNGRPNFQEIIQSIRDNGGTSITLIRNNEIKTVRLGATP